ncbi:capsular exopolysaccharide synthesis family protein [Pseudarthrobacter sp. W1I19]|uniref:polysaccharide biosynthesis tyrosine autokinase n=1 Tax=Pseudarthrobacter sp. W1I19 TaxID=3042288 RepID=UPI0027820F3E|nr:polysaccharide biosynthesis tyrosine autokinase [Pseudarthrobacter sp. W1I19]MDQ0922265.1 capsular exopolysaccharide synthesis family protein [Pseudarthrobacter sp. W1I19]
MNTVDAADVAPISAGLGLADYLRIFRVHWKGILAFTLAATLAAFGWVMLQPKLYASSSSGIVVAGGSDNLSLSMLSDTLTKSKAANYKSVAMSRPVAERVIESLDVTASPDALLGSVTAEVVTGTTEVMVTVTSVDPVMAQRLADAWIAGLVDQAEDMERSNLPEGADPEAVPVVKIVPLAQAPLPSAPYSPNTNLAYAIGSLSGLLLGLGFALLRNHLDRRLRDAGAIEREFGVPVIGTLPIDRRLDGKSFILDAQPERNGGKGSHAITEALRELRTNLQFIDVDNPPRVIVVTSSVQSEGKSTVTANLAVTMAAAGENVVVVDGDLRRPTVVDVFDLIPGAGVTDVLSGRAELDDVLQQWSSMPNLHVLGSGRIPPNPSELLGSRAMKTMLHTLAKDAIVLVDAPPLLPVTDAAVLTRAADGAIVVIRSGKTREDELGKSLGNLERVKGRVLGTILNYVPTTGAGSYGYYSSYTAAEVAPGGDGSSQVPNDVAALTAEQDDTAGGDSALDRVRSRRASK